MRVTYTYVGKVLRQRDGLAELQLDLGFNTPHEQVVMISNNTVRSGSKYRFLIQRMVIARQEFYKAYPVPMESEALKPYTYRIDVHKVYDGDTITKATVDLGFHRRVENIKFRMYGINTPEMRGDSKEQAQKSKAVFKELVMDGAITGRTLKSGAEWTKKGKYGRYLLIAYKNRRNINEYLVEQGLAVELI